MYTHIYMYTYVHIGSAHSISMIVEVMCVQRHILYVYVVECSYIHSFVGYVCLHTHAIALLVVCYAVYNAHTELYAL